MLQASKKWKWIACPEKNRLLIDLGDEMQLCTPYKIRQLTETVKVNPNFSLADAEFYQQVFQYLASFNLWNDAQICQIALNATAVKFYLQPVLTKSWFFTAYTGTDPSVEAVVKLVSKAQSGDFLIVDHSAEASLCINLSENFALDENLMLKQFEVIRVLNDRVHPILHSHSLTKTA